MRTHPTLEKVSGLLAAILFCGVPSVAQTSGTPATPDPESPAAIELDFTSEDLATEAAPEIGATYARIRYFEGGVTLQRENEEAGFVPELAVNSPLIPGDEVWTGADGRLEMQLADGSILRLDTDSQLTLLNLADREATFDDTTLVALLQGSLYVRTEGFDARERRFQIDTPAGSIFLLSPGVFRVDVTAPGVTTLASYRGVAEIFSEEVSVIAHSGEHVSAAPGRGPSEARPFNTLRRDEFDLWAEARDDTIASAVSAEGVRPDVPEPVRPYVSELSRYGDWQHDPTYGWIWIPDDVASTWRPYYYGHWVFSPIGFVWVSSEPWGWAPYHYGRWHHASGYGWFWAPGHLFSGAYVRWAIGPSYYAWSPLGYYGYPLLHLYSPWYYVPHRYVFHRNVHRHMHGWAYASKRHFHKHLIHLRRHPPIHPRYHLERSGTVAYNLAKKFPKATHKEKRRDGDPGLSFRHKELPKYRRLLAQKQSNGSRSIQPILRGKGKLRSTPRSGRVRSAPRTTAPGHQVTPTGAKSRRIQPIPSGMRTSKRPRVSPATGRPISSPVKATPLRARDVHDPKARSGSRKVEPVTGSNVRSGRKPGQGKVITPSRRGYGSGPARERTVQPRSSRRATPAQPHPRVEPRGKTPSKRFIMKRPSKSSKPPVVKRSRPSSGAKSKPATKGSAKKGGGGGKGKKKGGRN
jgi:hypothetical protein